jgi:hypothetical protein
MKEINSLELYSIPEENEEEEFSIPTWFSRDIITNLKMKIYEPKMSYFLIAIIFHFLLFYFFYNYVKFWFLSIFFLDICEYAYLFFYLKIREIKISYIPSQFYEKKYKEESKTLIINNISKIKIHESNTPSFLIRFLIFFYFFSNFANFLIFSIIFFDICEYAHFFFYLNRREIKINYTPSQS